MSFLLSPWRWLAWLCVFALPAHAHDPFDGGVRIVVFDDRIEAQVTLGYDAARDYLRAAGATPALVAQATRPGQSGEHVPLPLAFAPFLLTLSDGAAALPATLTLAAPARDETRFLLTFARPTAERVGLRAAYFDAVDFMRPGTLVVVDARHRMLASAPLSKAAPGANLPLTAAAASAAFGPSAFTGYLVLGVQHILGGYDHLLFLAALLLGVRTWRSMLGIVSAFTVAHSITLGLAALEVVVLPPALVEPLIAASIGAACLANLMRRETAWQRCLMAAGFGLIHGFGFAGALRETGLGANGGQIVMPLLSFNLGVEAGQLLVAGLLIPALMAARRRPEFARYGLPGLSVAVMAVSAWWLVERLA